MTHETFKQKIYGPYLDAWKIIKILQEAYQKPELFTEYMDKVNEFANQYTGNEFAELLRSKLLLSADDVITRMNEAIDDELRIHEKYNH